MQTLEISQEKFSDLEKLKLPKLVHNGESSLYLFSDLDGSEHSKKILKTFRVTRGPSFDNKIKTIDSLIELRNNPDMQQFVLPEKLIMVNREIIGYSMPYVPSTNLNVLLTNPKVGVEYKIKFLKEIGGILRKMKSLRESGIAEGFYLNDMHESNFIIDSETGHVKVVDLDSAKIGNNIPFISKYLSPYSSLKRFPQKYISAPNHCTFGDFIPDENTDLYCYTIMILNLLSGIAFSSIKVNEFFEYMDYLRNIGINGELIDIFAKIYSKEPNENPDTLLDDLVPKFEEASYYSYILKPKK